MVNKKIHFAAWIYCCILLVTYLFAIITNNDFIGDIASPFLLFAFTGCLYYGYVKKQESTYYKWFGWTMTLAVGGWAVCEAWWGIQTIFLHLDPDVNFITEYGYSLTNLMFFLGIISSGYRDFLKMNKIQALLDTFVVVISLSIMIWLFVLKKDMSMVQVLIDDPVSLVSVIIDIILYAWVSVWLFATRQARPPLYRQIFVFGGFLFVACDLIYYYAIYYSDYNPNSWLDGGYIISFTIIALSAYLKVFGKKASKVELSRKVSGSYKFGFELSVLFVPVIVFIFDRKEIEYFIFLIIVMLIYFVLINFTQKNIFQGKLLELEKNNVAELEKKVEERAQEIIHLMNTDYISDLYNRRYFEAALSDTLNNLRKDELVTVLYADLNKSKAIKHLYGIKFSEKLIKIMADEFKEYVKQLHGIVASFSDDVFIFLFSGMDADEKADILSKRVVERCEDVFIVGEHSIRVTLNIGIACYPRDTIDSSNLIKNADIAMMQARTRGFNRIQFYSEHIGELSYNRHMIEMKLKKVSFDKEFLLYYQPQVNCSNGNLCGFESLIRWFEGGKNFLSPLEFIPLAEETGIIIPLGYWILEHAACQYAVWKEKTGNEYKVAVNISVKQLIDMDFVKNLESILQKYHVDPAYFEVEITESLQIENDINIQRVLKDIKRTGVAIAIDDFGTGYSSLYYLKNLDIDRIKIAKELVDNIENELDSVAIIQMVLTIAKSRKIKVIAEGVETAEQWKCLNDLGCDEIQGYYFSKPLPAAEAEDKWISSRI